MTVKTQEKLLKAIIEKSRLIAIQQQKANKGLFKDYGAAIGLQRLRLERNELMAQLTKPHLIVEN